MPQDQGEKFIARNRAPRVQIEYDVELYGAEKKVQLPFVMGVMADLSGKPPSRWRRVADRKFLDIDVDNFDDRMKAMKPRVAFRCPTRSPAKATSRRHHLREHGRLLAGGGGAQGRALRKLLEAREQLANLLTYMDGKGGAEELIGQAAAGPGAAAGAGRRAQARGIRDAGLTPASRGGSSHGRQHQPRPRRPPQPRRSAPERRVRRRFSRRSSSRTIDEAERPVEQRRAHAGRAGAGAHAR